MKNAIYWLNGKKTIFGLVTLSVMQTLLLEGLVIDGSVMYVVLLTIGSLLIGTGTIHKFIKGTR